MPTREIAPAELLVVSVVGARPARALVKALEHGQVHVPVLLQRNHALGMP